MINCVRMQDFNPTEEGFYLAKYIRGVRISTSELGNSICNFDREPKIDNYTIEVKFNKNNEFIGFPEEFTIIWISDRPVRSKNQKIRML